MNKSTLFDLRWVLEEMGNSVVMARTLEKEITFTHERFQKEIECGQVDMEEYQHKLKFIDSVYYRHVLELEKQFNVVNKIAKKLYEAAR